MGNNFRALKDCILFRDICKEEWGCLISCLGAKVKTYKENEYIIMEGDRLFYVKVVLKGVAEVIRESLSGDKHIVAMLQASDMFAEGIVCMDESLSPVSVMAKKETDILLIPYEKIIRPCGHSCPYHLRLIRNMMLVLGEKNARLNEKIGLLTLKGMREKIAYYLISESNERKAKTFQVILNRTELAEYLNVSRTSMCRELTRMKKEGLIDFYGKSFKILDEKRLVRSIGG